MRFVPDDVFNAMWHDDSDDKAIRELYKISLKLKEKYFEYNIIKRLPQDFVRLYLDRNLFHDMYVKQVDIGRNKDNSIEVGVEIYNEDVSFKVIYNRVSKFIINGGKNTDMLCTDMDILSQWLFDEFYLVDNETMSHEVLLDGGIIIKVEFSSIKFVQL